MNDQDPRPRSKVQAYEYGAAIAIVDMNPPFYSVIATAMMMADSQNLRLLAAAFPAEYAFVQAMWNGEDTHDL